MIKVHRNNQEFIVTFYNTNRLNCFAAEKLAGLLPEFEQVQHLVRINFEGITFIDTSGFRFLFDFVRSSVEYEYPYRLCHVSDEIRELIEVVDHLEKETIVALKEAEPCH